MKRVVMRFSLPLFGQGGESLLCWETGLEIFGRETDANKVVEQIKELRPGVVLFDGDDSTIEQPSLAENP